MQRYTPNGNNSRPPPDQRRYPPQRPSNNWQEVRNHLIKRADQRQDVNDWRQRPGGARERGYRRDDRGYPRQEFNQFPHRREYGREGPPREYYQRNPMQINHRPFQLRPPPREYHSNYPPRDFRYPEGPREFREFYRPTGPRPRPPARRFDEPHFQQHPSSLTPSLMSTMAIQRRRSPPRFSPPPMSLMPKKEGPPKASLLPSKKEETPPEDDLDKEDEKSDSDASSYDQDEVEILIEKVDNDIAKQERILATARAKIAAEERNALEEAEGKESTKKQLLPDYVMQQYRQRQLEHNSYPCVSEEQLISDVYTANRKLSAIFTKKLKERDLILHNFGRQDLTDISNTQGLDPIPEPRVLTTVFPIPTCHPVIRSKLVSHIRSNLIDIEDERDTLVNEYLQMQDTWNDSVIVLEKKMAKREKKPSDTEPTYGHGDGGLINIQASPSITSAPADDSNQILSNAARSSRRAGFRSDVIRSEADWVKAMSFLGVTGTDGNPVVHKPFESLSRDKVAKEIPMMSALDVSRKSVFKDFNSLVLDPERQLQEYNNTLDAKWSEYDRSVFKTKLLEEGKDFYKISKYLDQKTTHDCIMYYYREKINLRLKNLLRRNQSGRGRKKKDKGDGDNLKPLFATFRLTDDDEVVYPSWHETIVDNSSSAEDDDDSNRFLKKSAFDTSAPVSPLGSPTLLDQQNIDWDEEESKKALRGFELFGRDFAAVASMVGSKTPYQCKAFFNNHRRKVREEKEALNAELKKKKKGKPGRKKIETNAQLNMDVEVLDQEDGEISSSHPEKKRKQESDPGSSKKKKKLLGSEISEETQNGDDNGSRKTVSYWSVSERAEFLKALAVHGKNFEAIAQNLGTKSGIQVRNYFHNSRRKLELDAVLIQHGHSTDGQIHGPANLNMVPKDMPKAGAEASKYIRNAEDPPPPLSVDAGRNLPPIGNMPNPRLPSSHYSNIPYHEQSTPTPIYTSSVKARSSSVDFGSFSTPVFDYGAADLAPVNSRHHAGNRNLPSMSIDALTTPSSAPASIDSSKSPYAPLSTEYLTLPAIREIGDAPVLAPIRSESSSIPDTPKFPSIRLNLRPMSSLDAPIGSSDGRFVTAASQHDPASTNISSNNPHSGSAQISKENTKTNTKSAASISHILGPKSPVFNSSASTPMAGASLKTTPAEDNVVVVVSTKLSGERILKSPSPARKPKLSRGPSPTSDLGISDEARTKDRNTELPSTNTRVVDEVSYMKPDAPESAGLIPQEISATPLLSSDEPTVVVPINLAPKENNQMDLDDRI